jgi:hypothetical protein
MLGANQNKGLCSPERKRFKLNYRNLLFLIKVLIYAVVHSQNGALIICDIKPRLAERCIEYSGLFETSWPFARYAFPRSKEYLSLGDFDMGRPKTWIKVIWNTYILLLIIDKYNTLIVMQLHI